MYIHTCKYYSITHLGALKNAAYTCSHLINIPTTELYRSQIRMESNKIPIKNLII